MNKFIEFINYYIDNGCSATMTLKKITEYINKLNPIINYKFQYINLKTPTDEDFSIKFTKTYFELIPFNPRNHVMISKIIFFDDETTFRENDAINGLVYDAILQKIIYIPEQLSYNISLFEREFEHSLEITPHNELFLIDILDGTTCGLYYDNFNDMWCISTRRGYDVSGLYLNNEKTYAECIRDQLIKYVPRDIIIENDHLILPDLDTSETYTIHFKDSVCHPWKNTNHIFTIKGSFYGIPSINDNFNKVRLMLDHNNNINVNKNKIITQIKQTNNSLGKIVITSNAKYFIPTENYEFIERCFYAYPKDKIFGHNDKHIYMTIKSYFNILDRERFIDEFQQYNKIIDYLKKIVDEVIIVLMNYYNEGEFLTNDFNKEFVIIAKQIKENVKFNATNVDEDIVRDIVCQNCNINPFYTYLSIHRKDFD